MIKLLKRYYHKSKFGNVLLSPIKRLYDFFWVNMVPETTYLKHLYKMTCKEELNLDNPKKIQEKLLWLRLNDKDPFKTLCSDKYLVRKYIKERIGKKYLIPLVFQTEDPKEITTENLPNYPVIVKTNHGCGGHVEIKNKTEFDFKKLQKYLKRSLNQNFYYKSRQWQYKNIKPRILVEKLLEEEDGRKIINYKLHCYNGKVDRIEVYLHHDYDNGKELLYYTTNWQKLDLRCRTLENKGEVPKPKNLSEMIKIAEILSSDFRFVRVDAYNLHGKIYIGELTFTPAMGTQGCRPKSWNLILGNRLKL